MKGFTMFSALGTRASPQALWPFFVFVFFFFTIISLPFINQY